MNWIRTLVQQSTNTKKDIGHRNVTRDHTGATYRFGLPLAEESTWNKFVEQLRKLDDYWRGESDGRSDVLGDTHSWLHTVATGREVVRLPDWTNLTQRECYILRGFDQEEGIWGFLGTLKGTGRVASVFNPKSKRDVRPVRTQLYDYVNKVLNSDDNSIAQDAHMAVQAIIENKKEFRGFGPAAATRLLTLARPDRLVSVNELSAKELGRLIRAADKTKKTRQPLR